MPIKKVIFAVCAAMILAGPFGQARGQDWRLNKSTHFIVYSYAAPESFISVILDHAEDYYNKIADELGFTRFDFWLWERRARIYVYDSAADYQAATGQPGWSNGCVSKKDKIIYTYFGARSFFETVLPHELGHIIFREFVGADNPAIPPWLDEGVASLQEKIRYTKADEIVKAAMRNNAFIGLDQLSGLAAPATADMGDAQAQLFYAEAYSVVNFLFKDFGRDKFVLFCQRLRDSHNLEKALVLAYNFTSVRQLDEAWQRYLIQTK